MTWTRVDLAQPTLPSASLPHSFQLLRGLLQPRAGDRPQVELPRTHERRAHHRVLGGLHLGRDAVHSPLEPRRRQEHHGRSLQAEGRVGEEERRLILLKEDIFIYYYCFFMD